MPVPSAPAADRSPPQCGLNRVGEILQRTRRREQGNELRGSEKTFRTFGKYGDAQPELLHDVGDGPDFFVTDSQRQTTRSGRRMAKTMPGLAAACSDIKDFSPGARNSTNTRLSTRSRTTNFS